jgi:hypothetical protein
VEPNEIDILAFTVLRNFQQINDAQESGLARQRWSNIRKTDWLDRIHFDLTFFHSVAFAHFDVGTHPYSDTASDFSSTNSIAKSLGKRHEGSLHVSCVHKNQRALSKRQVDQRNAHAQGQTYAHMMDQ